MVVGGGELSDRSTCMFCWFVLVFFCVDVKNIHVLSAKYLEVGGGKVSRLFLLVQSENRCVFCCFLSLSL